MTALVDKTIINQSKHEITIQTYYMVWEIYVFPCRPWPSICISYGANGDINQISYLDPFFLLGTRYSKFLYGNLCCSSSSIQKEGGLNFSEIELIDQIKLNGYLYVFLLKFNNLFIYQQSM